MFYQQAVLCLCFIFATVGAIIGPEPDVDELSSSRITGGTFVSPSDIPWVVGVFSHGGTIGHSFCGGVLVSNRTVLTVAACVQGKDTLTVALNASNMMNVGTLISVSRVLVHPNYSWLLGRANIAILTLERDAPVDGLTIQPVHLPRRADAGKDFVGWVATTSGWGNLGNRDNSKPPTQYLRMARDTVTSNLLCQLSYTWIRGSHICVATGNGGPCNGDEGAPVTVQEGGRTTLVGLHSFHYSGIGGCSRGRSAVHTRITTYLDWIIQNSDVPNL
ncbi:fibrinolytic enzyme, isozyme C-like [Toxorhynchites rutilus septentrionalis]|uniref:fibrinolytic enzyme, isozyme C-like n=1 Tax=Toxorhynchites rutilus septentrionalis TaxID=329112 RepID=UPI00247A9C94|nr:fibrinolytic enzyme, isozyme C-like [Toxorhynchites rutilus septentrionalis]